MPHTLGSMVVAAAVAEIVGLSFAAAVLFGLNRAFPRRHLRAWTWAWVAAGLVAALGIVSATLPLAGVRGALSFSILFLIYGHAAALQLGTGLLKSGDAFPAARLLRWALLAAALLALAGVAAGAPGPPRMILRFILPTMAVAAAALHAATALWRRATVRGSMGARLMAGALGLYGLTNAHHTAMYAAVLLGAPFPAYAFYFGFLSLAIVAVFALGAVVSLLEEERDLLLLSEEKAARLFRNSPDPIAVTLPFDGGRIVDVNERFEEVTGVRREEAIGRTTVDLGIFPDEEAQRAMMADTGATGVLRDKELTFVTRSGERRSLSIAAETFEWQGVTHAVVIARDITDRLAVQEQLRRARVMEALGSLVAGVAHEARNPLFAISALVDAMQAGDPAGRDFSAHTAQLKSQVDRLSRLMRDLLDYGRPSELRRGPVAVEAVARRAVSALEALAVERRVGVDLTCEEELPRVEADAARLEQVFENLIANAIQHSPAGSTVRVRIARDEDRLAASLRCVVEDDGPGIPEEDASRLFEPFYTARPGGTGLGLPIAQRVVEAHGGSIKASTRPSGGACFSVWLPLPVPEAGKASARP